MDLTNTAKALEKRGFEVYVCKDSASAVDRVMELVAPTRSVAWGGSETLKQLGVRDLIAEAGKSFPSLYNEADCFLLSANALTADGRIVNIDGTGNRVSASIYGPGAVIFVIGRNKIVEGGIDEAIARIKRCACPPNCRRLGKSTPCASTGVCADCSSPDRICKVTAIFDRRPTGTPTTVYVVNADLGY